jgi:hypothetical protein
MFGSYERTVSFFQKTDLMATGKPSAEELALLRGSLNTSRRVLKNQPWMAAGEVSGRVSRLTRPSRAAGKS